MPRSTRRPVTRSTASEVVPARASCWEVLRRVSSGAIRLQGHDQQRHPDQHAEPERDVHDEQRDGGDHQRGDRRGAERRDPHDRRGKLGVGGGDGEQFPVAHAGAVSARIEGAAGDLDPYGVRLPLDRGVRQPGAGAVGECQHGEEGGEAGEREQQRPDVAGGDRPVDDHADGDRDEGLGGLVCAEQRGAGRHPATVAAQGTAQHRPRGDLLGCHERQVPRGTKKSVYTSRVLSAVSGQVSPP